MRASRICGTDAVRWPRRTACPRAARFVDAQEAGLGMRASFHAMMNLMLGMITILDSVDDADEGEGFLEYVDKVVKMKSRIRRKKARTSK